MDNFINIAYTFIDTSWECNTCYWINIYLSNLLLLISWLLWTYIFTNIISKYKKNDNNTYTINKYWKYNKLIIKIFVFIITIYVFENIISSYTDSILNYYYKHEQNK